MNTQEMEKAAKEVRAIDLGTTTRTFQGQKQYLGRLLNNMEEPHKFDTSDYAMFYAYVKQTYIFVSNNY
jgi:hypothetical protein